MNLQLIRSVSTNAGPLPFLTGVLTSPYETFKAIGQKPTWIAPIIIAILIAMAGNAIYYLRVKPDWEQRVRARIDRHHATTGETMSPEQVAQQVAFGKTLGQFFLFLPVVSIPVFCLSVAGIFLLAFGLAFLKAPPFKEILSVVAWSKAAITTVGVPVVILVLLVIDKERLSEIEASKLVQSNLSVLLPESISPAIKSLATSLDLFTIWFLVLLTLGFAVVGLGSKKIGTWKTASLVFGVWLGWVVIKAALAFVFGY